MPFHTIISVADVVVSLYLTLQLHPSSDIRFSKIVYPYIEIYLYYKHSTLQPLIYICTQSYTVWHKMVGIFIFIVNFLWLFCRPYFCRKFSLLVHEVYSWFSVIRTRIIYGQDILLLQCKCAEFHYDDGMNLHYGLLVRGLRESVSTWSFILW